MASYGPFVRLPADLVPSVFGSLSNGDLHSLCLVCKQLRPLAEHLLYSFIHLEWRAWHRDVEEQPNITVLVRTLFDRPDLAGHAVSLSLTTLPDFEAEHGYARARAVHLPRLDVADEDRDRAIAFVQSTEAIFADSWVEDLEGSHVDAFVAVLLSLLPNLKTLRLDEEFAQRLELTGLVLKSACSDDRPLNLPNAPFLHLQDVIVSPFKQPPERSIVHDEVSENTQDIISFLVYLPAIRSLRLDIENPERDFTWPVTPHLSSTLTSLRLEWIREWHLGKLLVGTPALKVLDWGWYARGDLLDWYFEDGDRDKYFGSDDSDSDHGGDIADLDLIMDAILPVKNTLTDLTIRAKVDGDPGDCGYICVDTHGSMAGLVDFPRLQRLELPQVFLLGSFDDRKTRGIRGTVGPSVEVLAISDDLRRYGVVAWGDEHWADDTDLFWALESFLKAGDEAASSPPGLKKLRLRIEDSEYEWGQVKQGELRKLCEGAGVELEMELDPDDY